MQRHFHRNQFCRE